MFLHCVYNQTHFGRRAGMKFLFALGLFILTASAVSGSGYGHAGYGGPKYSKFGYVAAKILKGSCPYGWALYHGTCYYFSRDRLSWWAASMKCASMGGYLCNVDQAHENTYIRQHLHMYQVTGGAWMGLNDVLYPNAHRWKWGFSKKSCHKFDWYGTEPVYKKGGDWNCGIFWQSYQYHWHVESCAQRNYYVCEMKLGKPCTCQY